MDIVAISGSPREGSYNTALLQAATGLAGEGVRAEVADSLRSLPIFTPDLEQIPPAVEALMSRVRMADGVIFSTPEYAHGIPGVLKNALDWFVSSDALVLKPVAVMSVSTSALGGARGHSSLLFTLSQGRRRRFVDGAFCEGPVRQHHGIGGRNHPQCTAGVSRCATQIDQCPVNG